MWSAGCAAGQEAWSVAMLLDELTRTQDRPIGYRIIATDVFEPELAFAGAGVYSAEAEGNVRTRAYSRLGQDRKEGGKMEQTASIGDRIQTLYSLVPGARRVDSGGGDECDAG